MDRKAGEGIELAERKEICHLRWRFLIDRPRGEREKEAMKSIHRFLRVPDDHFFLFGPRGTGKSTWLRDTLPGAVFLDFLKPATQRTF